MIARILREDNDSRMLSSLPKFQETLNQHDTNIEESTQTFQHEMKMRNKEKLNTIVWCEDVLRTAEKQAEQESIALLDNFAKYRKHQFRMLEKQGPGFNFGAFKKEMNAEIEKLEDGLLDIELKLQESLQESTTNFQERVKKILEDMKEKTGRFIKKVQEEMELFSQALKTYAVQEFERIASMGEDDANGVDAEIMSDDMIQLMSDNETLNAHLEASKENVDSKISDQETKIVRELMTDWRNTETRIIDS